MGIYTLSRCLRVAIEAQDSQYPYIMVATVSRYSNIAGVIATLVAYQGHHDHDP